MTEHDALHAWREDRMMFGRAKRISLTALLILVLSQGCAQLAPSPAQQAASPSPAGPANEKSASHTGGSGLNAAAAAPMQQVGNWPVTAVAERDFATAEIVIDDRSKPGKLWLMSAPENGVAHALEFFSGEHVADVQVESLEPNGPDKRLAYSFTDRSGRRYSSILAMRSIVEVGHPSSYGGWEDKEGRGHDVVLGATLFERKTVTGPDGIPKTVSAPIDARPFFDGQPVCEEAAYVARTQGSRWQDSGPDFVPRAKIFADYDATKRCWNTQPIHAVNLEDNTILIITGGKAIRLSSSDLSPVGTFRNIRIIDVKE